MSYNSLRPVRSRGFFFELHPADIRVTHKNRTALFPSCSERDDGGVKALLSSR